MPPLGDIIHTGRRIVMLAAVMASIAVVRSVVTAATVDPVDGWLGDALLIDPGFRLATGATAPSINCWSINCAIVAMRSSRTNISASGFEKRASSCVMMQITAIFAHGTVTLSNASF